MVRRRSFSTSFANRRQRLLLLPLDEPGGGARGTKMDSGRRRSLAGRTGLRGLSQQRYCASHGAWFEGEVHPTVRDVTTLSCRGCHLNEGHGGGRMGAPKPLHKVTSIALRSLSCTVVTADEAGSQAELLQTSLAHSLGLPAHVSSKIRRQSRLRHAARSRNALSPSCCLRRSGEGQRRQITPLTLTAVTRQPARPSAFGAERAFQQSRTWKLSSETRKRSVKNGQGEGEEIT